MIIDAFMWSYEEEAVRIRLDVLKDVVDYHVAVQATNTFRGEERPLMAFKHDKLINVTVTIPDGLNPWQSEEWLRNQVLIEAQKRFPGATYIISDGDEIPHPKAIKESRLPSKLMTDYRNFYADWRAVEHVLEHQPTIGTTVQYKLAGGANEARWHGNWRKSNKWGWHLSSLGDTSELKLKTFAHSEYDTPEYIENLNVAKDKKRDFLDRFDLECTEDIPPGTPEHLLGGKI